MIKISKRTVEALEHGMLHSRMIGYGERRSTSRSGLHMGYIWASKVGHWRGRHSAQKSKKVKKDSNLREIKEIGFKAQYALQFSHNLKVAGF